MSASGAITAHIDVAQAVLYAFWIFFAGLVFYLHREDKREGYPLRGDGDRRQGVIEGFPSTPPPKTFRLADGSTRTVPRPEPATFSGGQPTHHYPGSPITPVGDPLQAGVGPGSWSGRDDIADITAEGDLRLVPLRAAPGFGIAHQDPDPRGYPVFGSDSQQGGIVRDLWVDRSEAIFRYFEVETPGGRRVLLPVNFSRIRKDGVSVHALLAEQFANVPKTRNPEQVTLLEEEKIMAYYGAGLLYATPDRMEPLL